VLAASSFDDLKDLALSLVFECLQAERGALLLRDAESGELVTSLLHRRDRKPVDPDELRVPRSIVREVASGQVGLLTSDALHDPRFESRASVRDEQIRSALCAPLWVDGHVLGALYLDSRIRTYAFTREDLDLLNAIANLIAIRMKQQELQDELGRERVVRSNLSRYHSPGVVEAIMEGVVASPQTRLQEREVSILFADIEGFTQLAESVSPGEVADLLGRYYTACTRAIFDQEGTVNEYVGDSVLAIFGAPLRHDDHADRAVKAALHLLRDARGLLPAAGRRPAGGVRVGINSGAVVVGSVGPPDRLKYAVVGDPVNVAARLEGLAAPGTILVGEETRRRLGEAFACTDLGPQRLRGRETPVRAYRIEPGGAGEPRIRG